METMKVIINPDGVTAEEINSPRTLQIVAEPIFNKEDAERERPKWVPGSIWNAIEVKPGLIKIID